MNDRDRLAADLEAALLAEPVQQGIHERIGKVADRLIALGWTRLDEERLARALRVHYDATPEDDAWHCLYEKCAAAIAKAYREDTDASDA